MGRVILQARRSMGPRRACASRSDLFLSVLSKPSRFDQSISEKPEPELSGATHASAQTHMHSNLAPPFHLMTLVLGTSRCLWPGHQARSDLWTMGQPVAARGSPCCAVVVRSAETLV